MEFYRRIPDENIIIDRILKLVIDILVVIVIAVFVSVYLCKEEKVTGNSMASVLNSNEKVFVDTISYNIFEPDRYDVVMFNIKSKDNMEETYI
ncbi:MAG: S26 family signal peptidase, partial [Lachnospiraceae bacterium]|nr:S26 family signal peptidase [Lachnospiraceae bacterium]